MEAEEDENDDNAVDDEDDDENESELFLVIYAKRYITLKTMLILFKIRLLSPISLKMTMTSITLEFHEWPPQVD